MSVSAPPAPSAPTPLGAPPTVHREDTGMAWVAEDRRLLAEWLDLARRLDSTYGQTPDWVVPWWRHRGQPETTVTTWRDSSGDLLAVVPLSRTRVPVSRRFGWTAGVAATSGAGPYDADPAGWLVDPRIAPVVRAWAEEDVAERTLLVPGVASAVGELVLPRDARPFDGACRPRLPIPADPARPHVPTGVRALLRRHRRALADRGVRFSWIGPGRLAPGALWTLRHLRLLRIDRSGPEHGPQMFDDHWVRLHAQLAEAGHRDRGPAAVAARHGGSTIGMLYGVCWGGTFVLHQVGWDPAWTDALGPVLIDEAIDLAGADGVRRLDFLPALAGLGRRFGALDALERTWYRPVGPAGRVLRAVAALRGGPDATVRPGRP